MYENRKRRWGDRYDGFKLRHISPFSKLMPYGLKTRAGSVVFYEINCKIDRAEEFIRNIRKESYKGLSYTHIVMTAITRSLAENPKLNRFVSGRTIFARNSIRVAMAAKTALTADGKEFQTITKFNEYDSLFEAAQKFDEQIDVIMKDGGADNDTDKLLNVFCSLPRFLMNFAMWVIETLDYFGIAPKALIDGLPFFVSAFVTHLGSLGGDAVFHHLYDFGNTTLFFAIGKKNTEYKVQADGSVKKVVTLPIKVTLDERIAEGFEFVEAIKALQYYIENPALLMERGTKFIEDPDL